MNSSEFSTLTATRDTAHDRDRIRVTEEIIQVAPKGALLFAAPQPFGADVRLKGDGFGNLRATSVIQPNQRYTSVSLESTATADALAAASGPIPQDIRTTYLQLPGDLPSRIKQLADQQTAGRSSPFLKAAALEAYLRDDSLRSGNPATPTRPGWRRLLPIRSQAGLLRLHVIVHGSHAPFAGYPVPGCGRLRAG